MELLLLQSSFVLYSLKPKPRGANEAPFWTRRSVLIQAEDQEVWAGNKLQEHPNIQPSSCSRMLLKTGERFGGCLDRNTKTFSETAEESGGSPHRSDGALSEMWGNILEGWGTFWEVFLQEKETSGAAGESSKMDAPAGMKLLSSGLKKFVLLSEQETRGMISDFITSLRLLTDDSNALCS